MSEQRTIGLAQLQRELETGRVEHFWNVLTDEYFKGETIPGSERVPLDRLGRIVSQRAIAKPAAIVVFCAGPDCPQSHHAAEKLSALGYTDVRVYEGGIEEWKSARLPIENAVPSAV